jgi:hypothetical protein
VVSATQAGAAVDEGETGSFVTPELWRFLDHLRRVHTRQRRRWDAVWADQEVDVTAAQFVLVDAALNIDLPRPASRELGLRHEQQESRDRAISALVSAFSAAVGADLRDLRRHGDAALDSLDGFLDQMRR